MDHSEQEPNGTPDPEKVLMAFTQEQLEALAKPLSRVVFDIDTVNFLRWVKDHPDEWAAWIQGRERVDGKD